MQGQVFLKRGVAHFLFNIFKVYHFYIIKLFHSLQTRVIHLKNFLATIIL